MLDLLLKKIFGTKHDRDVKRLTPNVHAINALEPSVQALSDEALRAKTDELRAKVKESLERADTEDRDELKTALRDALDDVLVEAFAVCREAARRHLGMRHFDVQLIGGM